MKPLSEAMKAALIVYLKVERREALTYIETLARSTTTVWALARRGLVDQGSYKFVTGVLTEEGRRVATELVDR